MSGINFVRNTPVPGISIAALHHPTLDERIGWAIQNGYRGIELLATGEPWGIYAPTFVGTEREKLRDLLSPFDQIAVQAPYQATLDVTLVSPSAAIRRASCAEIWSVCRFVEALGGGVILVRAGMPPHGLDERQQRKYLSESLRTIDKVAGDHDATIGIANFDLFTSFVAYETIVPLNLTHTGISIDLDAAARNGNDVASILPTLPLERLPLCHVRIGGKNDRASVSDHLLKIGYTKMLCLGEIPTDLPVS